MAPRRAALERVLVAHNLYLTSARSGEDGVYRDETRRLEAAGIEVVRFERKNDVLASQGFPAKIGAAAWAAWSREAYREVAALIDRARPSVAHFHNIFPLITPAAFLACREAGVPVVHTLHNYRFGCLSGLLLRDEHTCERCWGVSPLPGILHGCYQGSRAASVVGAAAQLAYRRHAVVRGLVSRFVALTDFSRRIHVEAGIPAARISVKGNFAGDDPVVGSGSGGYALFVGRFGPEKGVRTLLRAWEQLGGGGPRLRMVGGGPLMEWVEGEIGDKKLNVEVVGPKPRAEVMDLMREAAVLVVPSECYEGFPLVIAEAMACGTPVIAARTGGLPEIVRDGVTGTLVAPADAGALAEATKRLLQGTGLLGRMRKASREVYEAQHSPQRSIEALLRIYQEAIADP